MWIVTLSGGHTSDGNVNDVYELNLQTWTWSLLEVPDESQKMSPRDKHTAWFYNNKYVFCQTWVHALSVSSLHAFATKFVDGNAGNESDTHSSVNKPIRCSGLTSTHSVNGP